MIERKIKNAPAGQGTIRMLIHEEWERIREERPRTLFESKLACPNARIRTGESLRTVRSKYSLYGRAHLVKPINSESSEYKMSIDIKRQTSNALLSSNVDVEFSMPTM